MIKLKPCSSGLLALGGPLAATIITGRPGLHEYNFINHTRPNFGFAELAAKSILGDGQLHFHYGIANIYISLTSFRRRTRRSFGIVGIAGNRFNRLYDSCKVYYQFRFQ